MAHLKENEVLLVAEIFDLADDQDELTVHVDSRVVVNGTKIDEYKPLCGRELLSPEKVDEPAPGVCGLCNILSWMLLIIKDCKEVRMAGCDDDLAHVFIDGRPYCTINRPPYEYNEDPEALIPIMTLCPICQDLLEDWHKHTEHMETGLTRGVRIQEDVDGVRRA